MIRGDFADDKICQIFTFFDKKRSLKTKKKDFEDQLKVLSEIRRRHRLPGRVQPSTFSAKRLNFRVRDENGWVPLAIATGMVGNAIAHPQLHSSISLLRSHICLTV